MFALVLTKDGNFYKLLGHVSSPEEANAIGQKLIEKYGEQWLIDNGYRLNVELAG